MAKASSLKFIRCLQVCFIVFPAAAVCGKCIFLLRKNVRGNLRKLWILLVDQKGISFVVNAFEWHLITARKYNFKLKAI